jgi:hypothetical protein
MNGRSDWLVPEARADLVVVVQAMREHSLHTSLAGKTSDHGDLDGRAQVPTLTMRERGFTQAARLMSA